MIVYVLFVHKKSVSKRKVCILKKKKIKNLKKPKKPLFSGFFMWVFGFFWVGFLLPTLLSSHPVLGPYAERIDLRLEQFFL